PPRPTLFPYTTLFRSPLGTAITGIEPATLAGQGYLLVNIDEGHVASPPRMLDILARLGATSEAYEYFEHIGEIQGPLLRPLEPQDRKSTRLNSSHVKI